MIYFLIESGKNSSPVGTLDGKHSIFYVFDKFLVNRQIFFNNSFGYLVIVKKFFHFTGIYAHPPLPPIPTGPHEYSPSPRSPNEEPSENNILYSLRRPHRSRRRSAAPALHRRRTYLGDLRVHGRCSDGGRVCRRRAEWNANTERDCRGQARFLANPDGGPGYLYPDTIGRCPPSRSRNTKRSPSVVGRPRATRLV